MQVVGHTPVKGITFDRSTEIEKRRNS